jgi:hypothetical protein
MQQNLAQSALGHGTGFLGSVSNYRRHTSKIRKSKSQQYSQETTCRPAVICFDASMVAVCLLGSREGPRN